MENRPSVIIGYENKEPMKPLGKKIKKDGRVDEKGLTLRFGKKMGRPIISS